MLVRSIQSKRVTVDKVCAALHKCLRIGLVQVETGQACSFALRALTKKEQLKRSTFRKGMVLLDRSATPKAAWIFEAEVVILHHATTLKERYQAVVHCGVIRQAAQVGSRRDVVLHGTLREGEAYLKSHFAYRLSRYLNMNFSVDWSTSLLGSATDWKLAPYWRSRHY